MATEALDLLHQLGERLTAAGAYLAALRGVMATVPQPARPRSSDMLEKALSQLAEADGLCHRLRRAASGAVPPEAAQGERALPLPPAEPADASGSPDDRNAGRNYRVCFLNHFARGSRTFTACQRSIVIPVADSAEQALEIAKQRFAELEGIRDWRIHAVTIEVGLIEVNASAADPRTE
jgi:hypothetical protein